MKNKDSVTKIQFTSKASTALVYLPRNFEGRAL
jgi:hypothetical protein